MRACGRGAARLKLLLDQFAEATGLVINFAKRTLVPMHADADSMEQVVAALVCAAGVFPQSYLGLPLSWEKLRFADFLPMIAKVDVYLVGWAACLLSPAGRLILINAVLDALPTYAMAALLLPPAVIRALDGLRRSFLWNIAERASGAQCLVAWCQVCRAKAEGGLGVRDLVTQNECLLLKMIHRLHASPRSRWASWVWAGAAGHSLLSRGELALGEHRASIVKLLPLYRSLTRVDVGDGRCCSFWWDCWLPCGAIASAFPALLSHSVDREATVWQVQRRGFAAFLVPRLTAMGARELLTMQMLLAEAPNKSGPDKRQLVRANARGGGLSSSTAYGLLQFGGVTAPYAAMIWGARVPSRIKFFCWLLVQQRIHTRDILLRKCILAADEAC